ncbi:DUF1679 domain-containing protein [Prolixibacteraceae bacterium]|nr:DUF1679 domain-containing protein [Prolixibacteraceae bacterium]
MENRRILELVKLALKASSVKQKEVIQQLWSGYGNLSRCRVEGREFNHVIVKHIKTASMNHHPRGWNTSLSHERKVKSYQVEIAWYQQYAELCDDHCRVPHCLAVLEDNGDQIIVMEDLDVAGFPMRKYDLSMDDIFTTLRWLAFFHAKHIHTTPESLWEIGTYWHLDTRPDELQVMSDKALKGAAAAIDEKLNSAKYLTLVHGDAKVANFCYAPDGSQVAGVDFQYVGAGCGMKDVAYFVSSCLYESDCERYETTLLEQYFSYLEEAMNLYHPTLPFREIEEEWRALYIYAWTDFYRFLQGWSPDHWKINGYNQKLARQVIQQLKTKK